MSSKLRYGKRFGSPTVGAGYRYDISIHRGLVPKFGLGMTPEQRARQGAMGAAANAAKQSHCYLGKPVVPDLRDEAEERLLERINQCIDVMIFGVHELMMAPPAKTVGRIPLIHQQQVIDWIDHLCVMIGREEHNWGVMRRPGLTQIRHCLECGTELLATEKERCHKCSEEFGSHKQAALELVRAEREAVKEKARQLRIAKLLLKKRQKAQARIAQQPPTEDTAPPENQDGGAEPCN